MSRRRHTPEQITRKLAEGQKLLAGGMTLEEVCRQLSIAGSTWARWLSHYGGIKADDANRLKELEGENARLKKLLAEAELEKPFSKRSLRETSDPETSTGRREDGPNPVRGIRTIRVPDGWSAPLNPTTPGPNTTR